MTHYVLDKTISFISASVIDISTFNTRNINYYLLLIIITVPSNKIVISRMLHNEIIEIYADKDEEGDVAGQQTERQADVLGDGVMDVVVAGDLESAVLDLFSATIDSMSSQDHD